jgi:hypothetical protein
MRLALLVGIAFATTVSFAQSNTPVPPITVGQPQAFSAFAPPIRDFSRLWQAREFRQSLTAPHWILPGIPSPSAQAATEIDPKILIHPPQAALGELASGTLVAQNLYPGLEFKRIGESHTSGGPIPTVWPNLRIENIPTVWPKLNISPVTPPNPEPWAKK